MNLSTMFSTLALILALPALAIALASQRNHKPAENGRYQIVAPNNAAVVILDTATGDMRSFVLNDGIVNGWAEVSVRPAPYRNPYDLSDIPAAPLPKK